MPRKKKEKNEKLYEVDLVMAGETLKTHGDSFVECLEQLKPSHFKSKAVLIGMKGGLVSKRILRPVVLKRLVVQPVAREIMAKQLSVYLQ